MDTPLVSVIVPVYKVEEYLERCVDSILAQTYSNLQVILVDDGSPDDCGRICDRYGEKDLRVLVIHKENGGLSSARNAGLDRAEGEYIAFVDSDDWIEPDMYQTMVTLALEKQVPLVCAGRYDVSSETGQRTVGLCPAREEVISGEELVRRIFTWEQVDSAAWDKLYHRELFADICYPLGVIVEDVPVTYQIALKAGKVAMCPKPFLNYFHRPGSITSGALSEKTFHFVRHTEKIYPAVCKDYPGLTQAARYLRVRSLTYSLLCLELANGEARRIFRDMYRQCRRELKGHLGFVVKDPLFSGKEKRDAVLLVCGLYRPLQRVYSMVKDKK